MKIPNYPNRTPKEWCERKIQAVIESVENLIDNTTRTQDEQRVSSDNKLYEYKRYVLYEMLIEMLKYDASFDAKNFNNSNKMEVLEEMEKNKPFFLSHNIYKQCNVK